jgi:hypothetical protein
MSDTLVFGFFILVVWVGYLMYLMHLAGKIVNAPREPAPLPVVQHRVVHDYYDGGEQERRWRKAYSTSKSVQTYEDWKAWMQTRGYSPEAVLERAELSNQVSNRKR